MAETLVSNCTPPQIIPSILSKWSPIAAKSSQFPNLFPHKSYYFNPIPSIQLQRPLKFQAAAAASSSSSSVAKHDKNNEGPMGVDSLRQFIDLNLGKWNGSLYQFDVNGNLLQNVSTRLSASSYGVDKLTSLIQTNLKIPSRRPSVVCENCLYSLQRDMRARAFHIMDPKGVLDTLLIFLEERGSEAPHISASCSFEDISTRITPVLGRWEGHSVTKRSGVYGATIAEADTISLLEIDDEGHLIQDITSTSARGTTTNVHWTGTITDNLVNFDGGFQITLLPGGMYMGCPCNIAKSVARSQCFHLEFCWMESPDRRQRLIRTYDVEGLAVSSTHISETKV